MKVQFVQPVFQGDRTYSIGEVADLSTIHAYELIIDHYAVAVKDNRALETADLQHAMERATMIRKGPFINVGGGLWA